MTNYAARNYQSPYGFGVVTDALLDCVAERHNMTPDELSTIIHKNAPVDESDPPTGIYDWLDIDAWDNLIGPLIDSIERRIFHGRCRACNRTEDDLHTANCPIALEQDLADFGVVPT